MKTNYGSPQIEVIEFEVEDAVLSASGGASGGDTPSQSGTQTESLSKGVTFGSSLSSGY